MNLAPNPYCAHLISVAHQVVERLSDPDLRAAFLFGSAAWGDANAASDLDIMLLPVACFPTRFLC
jgi:predicted nucleotidyltransferase